MYSISLLRICFNRKSWFFQKRLKRSRKMKLDKPSTTIRHNSIKFELNEVAINTSRLAVVRNSRKCIIPIEAIQSTPPMQFWTLTVVNMIVSWFFCRLFFVSIRINLGWWPIYIVKYSLFGRFWRRQQFLFGSDERVSWRYSRY